MKRLQKPTMKELEMQWGVKHSDWL